MQSNASARSIDDDDDAGAFVDGDDDAASQDMHMCVSKSLCVHACVLV